MSVAAVSYCVRKLVLLPVVLDGVSMEPTFQGNGEVVLVEKVSTWFDKANYHRGDIVLCVSPPMTQDPNGKSGFICKRVLALPGDLVVNNHAPHNNEVVVPRGHVWLEGDNSQCSVDSRYFGPIPMALLQGKVFLQALPNLVFVYNSKPKLKDNMSWTRSTVFPGYSNDR